METGPEEHHQPTPTPLCLCPPLQGQSCEIPHHCRPLPPCKRCSGHEAGCDALHLCLAAKPQMAAELSCPSMRTSYPTFSVILTGLQWVSTVPPAWVTAALCC